METHSPNQSCHLTPPQKVANEPSRTAWNPTELSPRRANPLSAGILPTGRLPSPAIPLRAFASLIDFDHSASSCESSLNSSPSSPWNGEFSFLTRRKAAKLAQGKLMAMLHRKSVARYWKASGDPRKTHSPAEDCVSLLGRSASHSMVSIPSRRQSKSRLCEPQMKVEPLAMRTDRLDKKQVRPFQLERRIQSDEFQDSEVERRLKHPRSVEGEQRLVGHVRWRRDIPRRSNQGSSQPVEPRDQRSDLDRRQIKL